MYLFQAVPCQHQRISHSFPQGFAVEEFAEEQAVRDPPKGTVCLQTVAYRSPVTEYVRAPLFCQILLHQNQPCKSRQVYCQGVRNS